MGWAGNDLALPWAGVTMVLAGLGLVGPCARLAKV
jgi:hypothetical protein